MSCRSSMILWNRMSCRSPCHAIAEWYYENGCHLEARCHAGLDPASFPQKELLEKDTGASPVRQNLRDWKVFILCPGLAYRKWVVISFIKTMLFRSSMSCRSLMIFWKQMWSRSSMSCRTWSGIFPSEGIIRERHRVPARCDSTFGNVGFVH